MRKVYVVEFMDYDTACIPGVFTSMKRAKEYIEDQPRNLFPYGEWRNRLDAIPFVLNNPDWEEDWEED